LDFVIDLFFYGFYFLGAWVRSLLFREKSFSGYLEEQSWKDFVIGFVIMAAVWSSCAYCFFKGKYSWW